MLFSNLLLMLSASPRMSGFIYQVSRGCLEFQGIGNQAHNGLAYKKEILKRYQHTKTIFIYL